MRSPRIRTTLSRIGARPVPSISVPPTSASGPFGVERPAERLLGHAAVTASPARTTTAERTRGISSNGCYRLIDAAQFETGGSGRLY